MVIKSSRNRRAAFLDRDGVITREFSAHEPPPRLEPLPGVARALKRLREAGWFVIVVTNQAAVARGLLTEKEIRDQHAELAASLGKSGGSIDAFYFCPHHPDANDPRYRAVCECRKPAPGLFFEAAKDFNINLASSAVVGDRLTDLEAGLRAGCGISILIEDDNQDKARIVTFVPPANLVPNFVVKDLSQAVEALLATPMSKS